MPEVPIPLVGPSYESRERPLSAQATKNLYPSIDPEAKSIVSLHRFPGMKSWSTITAGADRGIYEANGVTYKVTGNTLYSIDSSGTETSRGTIAGTGHVDFAHDDTYLVIVVDGSVEYLNQFFIYSGEGLTPYQYEIGTATLTEITDTDLTTIGNGVFAVSDVADPDSILGSNVATAESHPDGILRNVVYNQLVYFFGSHTVEPWWNSGTGNPPFDRVQGAVRPYGLAGRMAVATIDEHIYFLDSNRQPQRVTGLQFTPFGNNALGKEWATYSDVSDCEVLTYIIEHQRFVQFNFPSANRSWCYHEPSGQWFQLAYGVNEDRHRGSSYCYCYGKHLFSDHSNGVVYEADFDTYQDNGEVIQLKRCSAPITGLLYEQTASTWINFDAVYVDVLVGVGINTGQGSDPEVMVRYSDDGGYTWSAQVFYKIGAGGDYLRQVILYDQGKARNRVYEFTYSDPTAFSIISASAEVTFTHGPG